MRTALALKRFVPSGPDFECAIAFFAELGFELQWRNAGLAGLRRDAAAFMLSEGHVIDPACACWPLRQALPPDLPSGVSAPKP